jgi:plasmid stability protein
VPTNVTIRNVPEDVRDELAARAARSGRSLQEYLQEYLQAQLADLAHRASAADVLIEIRHRARTYPPASPEAILEDLDADRR